MLKPWLPIPHDSDFSIHNLPFGIFSDERPARAGLAIGEWIVDLAAAYALNMFPHYPEAGSAFRKAVLNDLMAIGVILALQEAGYNVPNDVAVMGFDNIPKAKIVRPALTTIAQDPRGMGLLLAQALFDRMLSETPPPRRVYESTCELIVRDSA